MFIMSNLPNQLFITNKAKEYAEYVKNYVEERDKEIENKKKRK